MNLEKIVGNDSLKQSLVNSEHLSSAIIVTGAKGSGRHTLTNILTKNMLCLSDGEKPCGVCSNCTKIERNVHPDVVRLDRFMDDYNDTSKELKVDVIRQLRDDAMERPNQSDYKIYIIDRDMNINAQNAMLKLLEDGPRYAIFFIITENVSLLLETIRSRCITLQMSPVGGLRIQQYLIKNYPDVDKSTIDRAVRDCDGLIGRAIELIGQSDLSDEKTSELYKQWSSAIISANEFNLMTCAVGVQVKKYDRNTIENLYIKIGELAHDALIYKSGLAVEDAKTCDLLAKRCNNKQLIQIYNLSEEARTMCKSNVAPAHSSGWLAVKLAQVLYSR